MLREKIDRFLSRFARLVLRGFYRDVETEGWDRLPRDRPVLVVANHFNGFVDPALLVALAGRTPRFLAKASLWKVVPARPLLALAGILPVARPEDGAGTASNTSTFDACHEALRGGEVVALFPEGTTHDAERLDRVRTGAARIALGARASGVEGVLIVPVGIKFEDKIALRSRALARVGSPIDLDDVCRDLAPGGVVDESDHAAVESLTARIADRLADVSPTYDNWEQSASLALAAEITLRTDVTSYRQEVSLAAREDLAQRLAFADQGARADIISALERYLRDLAIVDLRDDQLVPGYASGALAEHVAWSGVRLVALAPAALTGAALNLAPYWVVKGVSRRVTVPVTKGTVRLLTALAAFPLSWLATSLVVGRVRGRAVGVLTLASAPFLGFASVYWFERWGNVARAWTGWQRVGEEHARLAPILERRAAVVAAVERAAGAAVATTAPPTADEREPAAT